MVSWTEPSAQLPDDKEEVWVRVRGDVRPGYYRIGDRWYAREDLNRWRMNTSRFWRKDRAWYVKTEDVEAWRRDDPDR